jgi:hypothetical protein
MCEGYTAEETSAAISPSGEPEPVQSIAGVADGGLRIAAL